jgi:DNA-binding MarR family transcriptional regulator
MTNRVDRLTARGLVERHPDPDDRRGVIVRLTPTGVRTVDSAFEALLAAEAHLLTTLSARDQKKLADLLRTLLAPFS